MKLNLINTICICGFLVFLVVPLQAYVQCGTKLCYGNTAQCCSWDKHECCWLSWYTLWWIWVSAIVFLAVLVSILICCFSKSRRRSRVRHMIVVPPACQYTSYGSITHSPSAQFNSPFKYKLGTQQSI